ncbi:hypothetical protein GCM10023263_16550 [Phytohabitans rumicis]
MVLFYEADGLLLSAGLLPVDEQHHEHLLAFQLSYLGTGAITVHAGVAGGPLDGSGSAPEADFAPVSLHGASGGPPSAWMSSLRVPDTEVNYRLTVWGQASGDDRLRGQLVSEVSGYAPLLSTVTRASVTRESLPERAAVTTTPWSRHG